jgi:hypothetical protein
MPLRLVESNHDGDIISCSTAKRFFHQELCCTYAVGWRVGLVAANHVHSLLITDNIPESVASNDEEGVILHAYGDLLYMRMRNDKGLHLVITQASCDSKDSQNTVLEHKSAGLFDARHLAGVAGVVIVSETKRCGSLVDFSTQYYSSVAGVGGCNLKLCGRQALKDTLHSMSRTKYGLASTITSRHDRLTSTVQQATVDPLLEIPDCWA